MLFEVVILILLTIYVFSYIFFNIFSNIKVNFNYSINPLEKLNETKKLNKLYTSSKKDEYIKEILSLIEKDLDEKIKYPEMNEICKYATHGGKRIRSKIIKELAFKNNTSNSNLSENDKLKLVNHATLFIEYLHSSSLVLDDIMDDDVERRGRPCTHIKYGLALAQMSSILLISIAIDHLNEMIQLLDSDKSKYAHKLFSDNFYKLSLGQYLDISNIKDQEPTEILMEYKTATLYDIAFQLGYLLNDNIIIDKLGNLIDKSNLDKIISKEDIANGNVANIKDLGIIYGKIFQLKDDFDDIEKDKKNKSNINYVLVNGKEKSIEKLNELSSKFNNFANELNIKLSNSVWGHSSI